MQKSTLVAYFTLGMIVLSESTRLAAMLFVQYSGYHPNIWPQALIQHFVCFEGAIALALLVTALFLIKPLRTATSQSNFVRLCWSKTSVRWTILTLFTAFAANTMFWNIGTVAAFSCDLTGNYEFGEYIYSILPRRESSSSLASYVGFNQGEKLSDAKATLLNKTVERLYGARSSQMAQRYVARASHDFLFFEDYSTEERYYLKALQIYRDQKDYLHTASVLSDLAFVQILNGHKRESIQSMVEVKSLIPHLSQVETGWLYDSLYKTAWQMGDRLEADKLLKLARKIS